MAFQIYDEISYIHVVFFLFAWLSLYVFFLVFYNRMIYNM